MESVKAKLFSVVLITLCFVLIRDIIGVINIVNGKTVFISKDIYSLSIGLVFIISLGCYVKQRVWRIGWSSVGISEILTFLAGTVKSNIGIILLLLGILLILFGAANFYISFKKEDFQIQYNDAGSKWNKLIFSGLILVIVLIFILYSVDW